MSRIIFGNLPHAVAAKRHAGEIEAMRIAVEFFYLGIQSSHSHGHDVRVSPVMMVVRDLRHDYHKWPALIVGTERVGQAYLGFIESIRAAFSGSVQKEDDGPFLPGGPVHREINDVVIKRSIEGDAAVEKSSVLLAGVSARPRDGDYTEEQTGDQVASQGTQAAPRPETKHRQLEHTGSGADGGKTRSSGADA